MKTFTIISSKEQKKYVIDTEATTMAELTAAMDAAGIDYNNMTLYEGLTKSEFNPTNAEAILPHDVPYKGKVTNDLVFMLTKSQKKIESGNDMSYTEMRSYIKEKGLTEDFKKAYGKNYTQGSTSEFKEFIAGQEYLENTPTTYSKCEQEVTPKPTTFKDLLIAARTDASNLVNRLDALILMYSEESNQNLKTWQEEDVKSPFSNDEINDMFANM